MLNEPAAMSQIILLGKKDYSDSLYHFILSKIYAIPNMVIFSSTKYHFKAEHWPVQNESTSIQYSVLERIYNAITAMGFSAMFTFQLDNTRR